MAVIKIIDKLDKDGKKIGEYAVFERVTKTESTTWNKEEVEREIAKIQEKLDELTEVLAAFTV